MTNAQAVAKAEAEAIAITESKKEENGAVFYGADVYVGDGWKIVTGPLDFNEAVMWVFIADGYHAYGKGAAWGGYKIP